MANNANNDGLDLDKVLAALSDDKSGLKNNSDSLLGLAKEVNTILTEFEKTIKMLDNMHVLPAIIRGVGKKYAIDVDTPLKSGSAVQPASDYHKLVFDQLNAMDANQIGQVLQKGATKDESSQIEKK